VVPKLAKYEIYEKFSTDDVCDYVNTNQLSVSNLRVGKAPDIRLRNIHNWDCAIYTVEITEEEAAFIMLSIPDIIIKKCDSKVNT
jgi:hypothetical protein